MGLNIKFYDDKHKEGELTSVGYIPVDTKARKDSKRLASSGAVAEVAEKVDTATEDLQEQIDDIAEKAGSGYTPKGPASVSTLNGLTGQKNGDLYMMTDSGTLTDGSLAVSAGDTVAWDEANSVWYKAMDYAPRQYGTNEVHNLQTTITAFRTGDVIPVDGPSGTAKMSKDDLLKVTADNALGSIHSLSDTATESDLVAGNYLALDGSAGTKKLPAESVAKRSVQDELVISNDEVYNSVDDNKTYAVTAGSNLIKETAVAIKKGLNVKVTATCSDGSWNLTSIHVKVKKKDGTYTSLGWASYGEFSFVASDDYTAVWILITGSVIVSSGNVSVNVHVESILSKLADTKDVVDNIKDGYYNIPVVKADAKHFRIVNGVWTADSAYDTFIFPASEFVGGTAVIAGNGIVATNVAFLTSDSIVDGTSVSFVSGTGLTSYANDKTLCLELPSGTNYVCVYIYRNNASEPYFKIKSGFVLDFFAPAKNQNVVGRKLNILEINLGGWAQGGGFATPTEQALDDLRQLCADCDVDILVPSESGNELIYRHFLNACFTQYWSRPANFSVYGVVPAIRIPYATKYKDVYMRSVPGQVTLGSDRGSRCLELEYNGFKGILVPAHWIYDESSPTATLDARFDEWLNDIGYTDYDFCIIVGDTNVMWGSSTITQDHPNFTHIVDYFTAKHFFWVNGGKSNSIVAQYRDTPFSLTDHFIKQTYFGSNSNQNYNIDQMLVWSKNNDLCVSVAYKVFTQAEMSTKYPNLYEAMGSSDHVPTIFKVNLN